MSRTVLAFGTFDYWHRGHEQFLQTAASFGDRLIVSVARDVHVGLLKHKSPWHTEQERLAFVSKVPCVSEAILSDEALGSYDIVLSHRPDVIAIGHDQDTLAHDLTRWMQQKHISIPLKRIERFSRDV